MTLNLDTWEKDRSFTTRTENLKPNITLKGFVLYNRYLFYQSFSLFYRHLLQQRFQSKVNPQPDGTNHCNKAL